VLFEILGSGIRISSGAPIYDFARYCCRMARNCRIGPPILARGTAAGRFSVSRLGEDLGGSSWLMEWISPILKRPRHDSWLSSRDCWRQRDEPGPTQIFADG
jgi:hypothetical protein